VNASLAQISPSPSRGKSKKSDDNLTYFLTVLKLALVSLKTPAMFTAPSNRARSKAHSKTGHYVFVFLFGLVAGTIGLVLVLRAIESRKTWQDHYPIAVMQLMSAHMAQLEQQGDANRCTLGHILPHLQALRLVGNDLEPAYGGLGSDRRFMVHASDFREQLDRILAKPPHNCALLKQARSEIGSACKACHQDFRT